MRSWMNYSMIENDGGTMKDFDELLGYLETLKERSSKLKECL